MGRHKRPGNKKSLMISLGKFPENKSFYEACRILNIKNRGLNGNNLKNYFIATMLFYLENKDTCSIELANFGFKIARRVKLEYNINSEYKLKNLLDTFDFSITEVNNNRSQRMYFTFYDDSEEENLVYDYLTSIEDTKKRYQIISDAINFYVCSGLDEEGFDLKVNLFIKDMVMEYRNANDQVEKLTQLYERLD